MKICFKAMWYGLFVLCKFSLKWLPSHSPVGFRWMSELFPLWLFFPTGFLYFEIILRSQKSRVKKRKKFCELWNFHNTGWGNAPHKGYNLTILDYNQPQTTCSINAFTLAHLADGNISCPLLLSCRCRSESMMGLCHGKSWSDSPFFPPRLLPYT